MYVRGDGHENHRQKHGRTHRQEVEDTDSVPVRGAGHSPGGGVEFSANQEVLAEGIGALVPTDSNNNVAGETRYRATAPDPRCV